MIIQTYSFVLPDSPLLGEFCVEVGIQQHVHIQRGDDPLRSEWCFRILAEVVAGQTTYDALRHEHVSIRITDPAGNVLIDTLTARRDRPWYSPQELLEYHSGLILLENYGVPSLVSTLRPYRGCQEASFAEFMRMTIAKHQYLDSPHVDSKLVLCFWYACQTLRLIGLSTTGPLQRNKRADDDSLRRLEWWYDAIESYIVHALSGHQPHVCLYRLIHYLCYGEIRDIALYQFVIPYARDLANDEEFGCVEDAQTALSKLGASE